MDSNTQPSSSSAPGTNQRKRTASESGSTHPLEPMSKQTKRTRSGAPAEFSDLHSGIEYLIAKGRMRSKLDMQKLSLHLNPNSSSGVQSVADSESESVQNLKQLINDATNIVYLTKPKPELEMQELRDHFIKAVENIKAIEDTTEKAFELLKRFSYRRHQIVTALFIDFLRLGISIQRSSCNKEDALRFVKEASSTSHADTMKNINDIQYYILHDFSREEELSIIKKKLRWFGVWQKLFSTSGKHELEPEEYKGWRELHVKKLRGMMADINKLCKDFKSAYCPGLSKEEEEITTGYLHWTKIK